MSIGEVQLEGPARELQVELQRQLQEHRRSQIDSLDRDATAWLAIAPRWSARLATAAGFPFGRRRTAERFAQEAADAGLCDIARTGSADAAGPRELEVLTALGAELPPALVSRALSLMATDDPHTLAELAPALPAELAKEFTANAGSIEAPADRAMVLTALLGRVTSDARAPVFAAAVDAARAAPPRPRARWLVALATADEAPPELVHEALAAIRATRGSAERARALSRLAPHFVEDPEPFLAAVRELPDPALRVEPALHVPGSFDEVTGWVDEIRDPTGRDAARRTLAGALARERPWRTAEAEARRIERGDARALALGELAVAYPDQAEGFVKSATLALAETVGPWRAVAVRATLARSLARAGQRELAGELADQAVEFARRQRPTTEALLPLCGLVKVLLELESSASADLAELALAIADSVGGDRERCEALLVVAPLLAEDPRAAATDRAQRALRLIPDPLERAPLLPAFVGLLSEAEGVRLVEETAALAADTAEELTFWVADPLRLEILTLVSDPSQTHRLGLAGLAALAGAAVTRAVTAGTPVPANVRRWAELGEAMMTSGPAGATETFLERHRNALRAGDAATALDWIDTGAYLAETVNDGRLAGAVRYARRKMELVYREAQDRRAPEPFLEREEQLHAFQELRDDKKGSAWALHYVGTGGVGKSSLIRYLQRRAVHEGFITAKVDFDYLSADYPVKRPAELLLQLMAELELHASPAEERFLEGFRDAVVKLHEESAETRAEDAEAQLDGPQFQIALRSFCGYLTALDKDVVLFLDTCEELTRFQPRGKAADNVKAAFGAIERIHAGYKRVRVVLAGRRLLAASGYGNWKAAHGMGAAQPPRDYLRIHKIDGFRKQEAQRFLRTLRKLQLSPEMERAVLDASPQPELTEPLVWDPPQEPDEEKRCNPFDLGMYADWITEEQLTDPKVLESQESDPYVDLRIVRRLQSDRLPGLLDLLPAVALLWRFDEGLIKPAYTGPPQLFQRVFEEFANQEWINAGETELVVDANLRLRLLKFFEDPTRAPQRRAAAAALAKGLQARLHASELGELTAEHLEAAVAILDPAAFTAVWHELIAKVADGADWHWAERVAGRLLGDEGALSGSDHPARAAVTAAFASALLHRDTAVDELEDYWVEVGAAAGRDPDPVAGGWLAARAFAARAIAETPAFVIDEETSEPTHSDALEISARDPERLRAMVLADPPAGRHRAEQYAAALLAALERLDDPATVCTGEELAAWADRLVVLEAGLELQAAARVLAARALPTEPARAQIEHALRCVDRPPAAHTQRWLDWLAPESPIDRVRLEAMRLGAFPEPPTLAAWSEDALTRIDGIDAERLLSAILERRLAFGPVDAEELIRIEQADEYVADRQPLCPAHRAVRPLFATIALGRTALGDAASALALLDAHTTAARQSALDPGTGRAGDLARLEVLRRMRVDDPVRVDRLARSPIAAEREAAFALAAVTWSPREMPPGGRDAMPWRYRVGLAAHREHQLVARDVEDRLDEVEYSKIKGTSSGPDLSDPPLNGPEDLRSALRQMALGASGPERLAADSDWWEIALQYAGARRLAELAFEEGELLALRLPRDAMPLLTAACDLFRRAGDPFGALIATIRLTLASAHAQETEQRSQLGAELRDAPAKPPPTGGWLDRRDVALGWCEGRTQDVPPGSVPPVELDLDPWSRTVAPRSRRASTVAIVVATLAGLAAVWWGAALLVRWVLGKASVDVTFGAAVGVIPGLVVLALLLRWCVRTLREDLPVNPLAMTSLRLTVIDDDPQPAGPPWPVPRDVTVRLEQRRPALAGSRMSLLRILRMLFNDTAPLRPTVGEMRVAGWHTPALGGYGEAARAFPRKIAVNLRGVVDAAPMTTFPLAVEAAPSLTGLPWEAVTAWAVEEVGGRLQPFRSARRPGGPPARPPPRGAAILFMVGADWRRLVTEGWADWDGPVVRREYVTPSPGPVRMVHAIGRPISGTAGQLLQIGAEQSVVATVEESVRASGLVAGAEELSEAGAVTILQAEPLDVTARTDTDREAAGKLKLLGADVFTAGAEAVLVIPALPFELATTVVRRVAERLESRRRYSPRVLMESLADDLTQRLGGTVDRDLRGLLALTSELRDLIRDQDGMPEVLAEIAADVCLFADAAEAPAPTA